MVPGTRREEGDVCAIFFDFQKAFDSVPHRPLLDKLSQLGVNEKIILWVANYLIARKQSVVLNGVMAGSVDVLSGVPHGSVLGPLLFIIYLNDLASLSLSGTSKVILYADDLALHRPITSANDYYVLQEDITAIENWTTANNLQFNISKCKYMMLSRRTPEIQVSPVTLNGVPLETFKYLGLLLSSDLSWSNHIDSVCSRAKRILGLLYRQYYHHADSETIRVIHYIGQASSGVCLYGVVSSHIQKQRGLEKVQKFACRMATKCWDAGYDELLDLLNLPSLVYKRMSCLTY